MGWVKFEQKRNQQQKSAFICTRICASCTTCPPPAPLSPLPLCRFRSVPAEGDVAGSVSAFLHQGLVKLPPGARVDGRPAVLAVVLQAGDVGAEERRELPAAASPLALVAQLVVQHVWLHFHLPAQWGMGLDFTKVS